MKGKVAVYLAARQPLEFREYTVPDPEPDSILVRMRMCNICGSDLHLWCGLGPGLQDGLPQILGHEMVGTIEKLGGKVRTDSAGTPLEEGDRIIYSYFRFCGTCYYCLTREANCPNRHRHWIGVSSELPPHFNGGFGEFYYLGPGHWIFKVPDELSDDHVSPVNCAAAEIAFGLRNIEIRGGETVLIQGAGGLGLYAIAMAREMGAAQIIVVDALPPRLELAKQFGADHLLDVRKTSPGERLEQVLGWTNSLGADVAIEVAGVPAAVAEGVSLLRNGGRYLCVGNINKGQETSFDPSHVVRGQLTVKGIHGYDSWAIPQALEIIARTKNKYPYESILSHHFKFEDINEAIALADEGAATRVSVTF